MQNKTVEWFGNAFDQLHPIIRQLHADGGLLEGHVSITYGKGVAGLIGRRLATKMGIPGPGQHHLAVEIFHDESGLHWNRCFNNKNTVRSLFSPVGVFGNGYWIENTGLLAMKLTVDLINGGWYWRCLRVSVGGIPIPRALVPATTAYKRIENGHYQFHVELSLPVAGTLICYRGLLSAVSR